MSSTPTLSAESRTGIGSRDSRRLRRAGRIPANVYRKGEENQSLTLDAHALDRALRGVSQVFNLDIAGSKEPCLVKEVQWDTFGQDVLHVDFFRVDLSDEVEVEVQLALSGNAAGVTEGGTLAIQHPALWVRCRADSIPERLPVDVTELGLGQSIHAGEIELPEGVVLDTQHMQATDPVITVMLPRVSEEPEVAEEALPEGVEAPADEETGEDATPAPEGKDGDKG